MSLTWKQEVNINPKMQGKLSSQELQGQKAKPEPSKTIASSKETSPRARSEEIFNHAAGKISATSPVSEMPAAVSKLGNREQWNRKLG